MKKIMSKIQLLLKHKEGKKIVAKKCNLSCDEASLHKLIKMHKSRTGFLLFYFLIWNEF